MNKDRRKSIAALAERIQELSTLVSEIKDGLVDLRDEEQDYFDNMPEGFQMADRGQNAEAAIVSLDDAISALDDFDADTITSSLEDAQA